MEKLETLKCEACRVGAPRATNEEINNYLGDLPEWEVIEKDDIKKLHRRFLFSDFRQAFDFVNRVGVLAEQEGHHPLIEVTWGRADIWWWTHKIGGLHKNDFIMAGKTDTL